VTGYIFNTPVSRKGIALLAEIPQLETLGLSVATRDLLTDQELEELFPNTTIVTE
jgi:hypothetical protein